MKSSNSRHVGSAKNNSQKKARSAPPLEAYRKKRRADATTEPFGKAPLPPLPTKSANARRIFVVHQHDATRLHWDLRLEWNGVLLSWAVPRGPSFDPAEKRLAVHVEDHPVEYGAFEGIIPANNYGAGPVILWDHGEWIPVEDFASGLVKGKLLFELRGQKLRGLWTLVRTKTKGRGEAIHKEWLLIKHRDAQASATFVPTDESVASGMTLVELGSADARKEHVVAALVAAQVPRRAVDLATLLPMLAEARDQPFSRAGYLFEIKYDGYRLLAERQGGIGRAATATLRYRSGLPATERYPDIAAALAALPFAGLILDGEVVVTDEAGRPSFALLQQRSQFAQAADIARAAESLPAVYFVFDLLAAFGYDLRALPVSQRKALLKELLPRLGRLRYSDHMETDGEALFAEVRAMGLEGIVAKRAASPYRAGRHADWLKIRIARTGDFAVVGYTAPQRSRVGAGAFHLAAFNADRSELIYAGSVGTGLSDAELAKFVARLDEHRRKTPPFSGPGPERAGPHAWADPTFVFEIRYKQWSLDGHLREPVFVRLRSDKTVSEIEQRRVAVTAPLVPIPEAAVAPEPEPPRTVRLSNLDKVFWPAADGSYKKRDLLAYYQAIAPWLLPYLRDRPLVMTRFPDGIHGKSFFQKDAPGFTHDWIRTERVWSQDAQREIDYFICDNVEALTFVVNLGAIPLHIWQSRTTCPEQPDWCIIDIDPKGAPFVDVVRVAQHIHRLCDEIGLPSYAKTSGSTGMHVLMPLGGQCTFVSARQLATLLARLVCAQLPEITTLERLPQRRGGKIYLDCLQNGHGKLLVGPFSARPVPGARVSMPLPWRDVTRKLDPAAFTIATAPARMQRRGDPMAPLLTDVPDLSAVLARLAQRVDVSDG